MTDERSVIYLGRAIQELYEPDHVLTWNGTGWTVTANPKIAAVSIPDPFPMGQWIGLPNPLVNPTHGTLPDPIPIVIGIDYAVEPVAKKKNKDGCACKKCKEFFPYAEPNQNDGSLICYACRHGL